MCDYSLESVKSRPAKVGEKLTAERFYTGTVGFKAPEDDTSAVCLECGMRAMLSGLPMFALQGGVVEGIFARDPETVGIVHNHHDGFLIDGKFVSLQSLQNVVIEVISTKATEQTIAALKASIPETSERVLEPIS